MGPRGFEPEEDGPGVRLASLAVPGCDFQGSNPLAPMHCSSPSFLAGMGPRGFEPEEDGPGCSVASLPALPGCDFQGSNPRGPCTIRLAR